MHARNLIVCLLLLGHVDDLSFFTFNSIYDFASTKIATCNDTNIRQFVCAHSRMDACGVEEIEGI